MPLAVSPSDRVKSFSALEFCSQILKSARFSSKIVINPFKVISAGGVCDIATVWPARAICKILAAKIKIIFQRIFIFVVQKAGVESSTPARVRFGPKITDESGRRPPDVQLSFQTNEWQ